VVSKEINYEFYLQKHLVDSLYCMGVAAELLPQQIPQTGLSDR
jgi:hypothetical protein